jgi:NADH-ubiquinone oxidoreductase chain 3
MFPFAVSSFVNNIYGLIILLAFSLLVTIGFIYELGKGALKLPSRGTKLEPTRINPAVYLSSLGRKGS